MESISIKPLELASLKSFYKDAFEYEFRENSVLYNRERRYQIPYKKIILPHRFHADFIVFNNVILEIKAKEGGIAAEDLAQRSIILNVPDAK
ncbi:GxxExxY protein [Niabella pedocola]|uniref:GxxExxY protein n=1 Tax=Niabella pedocola TaxID=1752077 RepID=A0ABS8PTG3_9BACT|nr:GxxExxY protein [Niabella pedocola]MCD2423201.1 GxxExxY protein [Niabella pedocola]